MPHIHQIYGILGDSFNTMSKTFRCSSLLWKVQAEMLGWKYRLWVKWECDNLVRIEYPEFWEMYENVREPIMKVDIVRFLILHHYGGIYADLDIFPNFKKFRVKEIKKNPPAETRIGFAVQNRGGKTLYEMEFIHAEKGCEPLLDFLRYAKTQIEEKSSIEIYDKWRWRYVFHTTGPRALTRWIKKVFRNEANSGQNGEFIPWSDEFNVALETYSCNVPENTNVKNSQVADDITSYEIVSLPSGGYIHNSKKLCDETLKQYFHLCLQK